ncbi:hypothetical protein [Nostoc sp.]
MTVCRPHGLPIFLTALPGRFIGVRTQPELRVLSTFGAHEKGMLSVERSLFQGIHVLTLNSVNQIVNLTESRHFILNYLLSSCQKYYLLS